MVSKRRRNRSGFTIIEVIVAIIMLVFGVLTFVASSAAVQRMLSRGNRATKAAAYSQERMGIMAATPCASLANGTATRGGVFALAWTVTSVNAGNAKRVRIITSYPGWRNVTRADTMEMSVLCVQ